MHALTGVIFLSPTPSKQSLMYSLCSTWFESCTGHFVVRWNPAYFWQPLLSVWHLTVHMYVWVWCLWCVFSFSPPPTTTLYTYMCSVAWGVFLRGWFSCVGVDLFEVHMLMRDHQLHYGQMDGWIDRRTVGWLVTRSLVAMGWSKG